MARRRCVYIVQRPIAYFTMRARYEVLSIKIVLSNHVLEPRIFFFKQKSSLTYTWI